MEAGDSPSSSKFEKSAEVYSSSIAQHRLFNSIESHNQNSALNADHRDKPHPGNGVNNEEVEMYDAGIEEDQTAQQVERDDEDDEEEDEDDEEEDEEDDDGEEDEEDEEEDDEEDDNNDEEVDEDDEAEVSEDDNNDPESMPLISEQSSKPPESILTSPLTSQNLDFSTGSQNTQSIEGEQSFREPRYSLPYTQFSNPMGRIESLQSATRPYISYHSSPRIAPLFERIGSDRAHNLMSLEAYQSQQISVSTNEAGSSQIQSNYGSSNFREEFYPDIEEANPNESKGVADSKEAATEEIPRFSKSLNRKTRSHQNLKMPAVSRVGKLHKRKSHYITSEQLNQRQRPDLSQGIEREKEKNVPSRGEIQAPNTWRVENQFHNLVDSTYSGEPGASQNTSGRILQYREQPHGYQISSPTSKAADDVSTSTEKDQEFDQFAAKSNFEPLQAWQDNFHGPQYQHLPSSPMYRLAPQNQQMHYLASAPSDGQHPSLPVVYTSPGRYAPVPSFDVQGQRQVIRQVNQAQAQLNVIGNLQLMTRGWNPREIKAGRRLVVFERRQQGVEVDLTFKPLNPVEYREHMCAISCIRRGQAPDYFVTSVDCIALLELIFNQKFSVEEKNRIRRNLEVCKPITVSKSKPELESFFRQIMGFGSPRPRNIEKDVKVFLWDNLENALRKIVSKYTASSVAQK